ncbi:MAG: MinD/ParA family protein [Burkholderiaceae bacterium]
MDRTEVIGIASGKGGVGKTTVAVNLAIALQQSGNRVMMFDADLGLANSQIAMGCTCPFNLSHFMSGQKTLEEIIVTTRQGIKLIPGASGVSELAALNRNQASRVVQSFSALEDEIDYLIVDMAAGISPSVLAFMEACQRRFIIVRDDPSSIADAYGMIKVLIQEYDLNEIYIIPNAVKNQTDGQNLFRRINQVCAQFLNYTTNYIGSIEDDKLILEGHRKFEPILNYAPSSLSARSFIRLAKSVTQIPRINNISGGMQFFVERLVRSQI